MGERLPPTPSQTVGPYFGIALTPGAMSELVPDGTPGLIHITGKVTDGAGEPVHDAMLEIWQADQNGRYGAGFTGFGRCHTEEDGTYHFRTVRPGRVPGPEGTEQAPHLSVYVYATGLLKPVRTRMYFSDEEAANATDPVLSAVDEASRHLLVAAVVADRARFDIRLQGDDETPFFDA